MAKATILVCPCGMRLRAAGAVPGRVGKCPACGGLLRVMDRGHPPPPSPRPPPALDPLRGDDAPRPGAYGVATPPRPNAFAATPHNAPRNQAPRPSETRIWDGLVRPPSQPDGRLLANLLYPLWGAQGITLLIFLPPVFWLTTIPWFSLVSARGTGTPLNQLTALLVLLPTGMALLVVAGYTLLFLGRVLVSSALGEIHHPRWPDWDLTEMFQGLGRWAWAVVAGLILGGLPSAVYWLYCGEIDLFDRIVLVELIAFGALYAEMALLASLLHDDPLGSNPVTVLRAIGKVRLACVPPALVIGAAVLLAAGALAFVLAIEVPVLGAFAFWLFWVGSLYGAMIVLRVLGLFYHRHARRLGWFRDRPRWGA